MTLLKYPKLICILQKDDVKMRFILVRFMGQICERQRRGNKDGKSLQIVVQS